MPSKICSKTEGRVQICCPFCLENFGKLATHLQDEKTPCAKIMKETHNLTREQVLTERRESIRKFGLYHLDMDEYIRLQKEPDPVLALCETLQLPISEAVKSSRKKPKNSRTMPVVRLPKLSGQTPVDLTLDHISCNCIVPIDLKSAALLAARSFKKRRSLRSKSGN